MAVIHCLKVTVFILTGELAVNHCLSNSFSRSIFISRKKFLPAMCSFKGTVIISIKYLQPSIPSRVLYIFLTLKFAAIKFCQRTFFQRISEHQSTWIKLLIEAAKFSGQYRLYWNESSHLKQLLFCRKISIRIPSFQEQLLLFDNYFLVTNTFSDFLISFFLKINTFSAQLLFRGSFLSRISNYSEHVLFRRRY